MDLDFFSSDHHFGDSRVLQLSRRPFPTVLSMNSALVSGINDTVPEEGTLYHLGDWGDLHMIKLIRCKVVLILGNYETALLKGKGRVSFKTLRQELLRRGFHEVYEHSHILHDMHLVHKPTDMRPDMFNLFGHIHGLQMVKRNGLNVGVDCHHFKPLSISDVNFYRNAIEKHYDEDVFCP